MVLSSILLSIPFLAIPWWLVSRMVNGLGFDVIGELIITGTLPENLANALLSNYWLLGVILLCIL